MQADQPDPSGAEGARTDDDAAAESAAGAGFHWLPRSRVKRALLALAAGVLTILVFSAYVAPGMVFDLANMVFCG
ncbi:MAG TPA: hypothetical protein VGN52_22940 [Burkholderiales bacterium]|jgi:hypothetical protein